MKKEAFTLLELIFVIVIIGVLSSVAVSSFKPHHLRHDVDFVLMKLEETRYQAMGYDKSLPALSSAVNYSIGCINIADLNDTSDKDTGAKAYKFYSHFDSDNSSSPDIICFDTLGRVHAGEDDANKTELSSLRPADVNLTYTYNSKEGNITIDHFTGYIRTSVQN